jgi:hypothetical protein
MYAQPIKPGSSYRVKALGLIDMTVFASNPCDAICIVLDMLGA